MFYIFTLIFLAGLAFGSFASVVIHRLHKQEEGILFGRSKCPHCAKELGVIDLIPLVSYVANQFKCRYCRESIALTYPLLELIMGSLFFLTAALTGLGDIFLLIFNLFITFAFVVLAFYDILFQEVPDEIVLPTVIITILFALLAKIHTGTDVLVGMLVPIFFFGLLFYGSQGKWLGGGDVRIGALMGALLAWPDVLIGLFLGYLLGAIYSLLGMAAGKLKRKSQIPFAPFLLTGTYITLFWGKDILSWYLAVM